MSFVFLPTYSYSQSTLVLSRLAIAKYYHLGIQAPIRGHITALADDIVRDAWGDSHNILREFSLQFAADVLIYIYEDDSMQRLRRMVNKFAPFSSNSDLSAFMLSRYFYIRKVRIEMTSGGGCETCGKRCTK
ncbi:hypothetical protein F5Y19DRAFT_96051 [Xylariaceae sp. FL1651]|nr:hypothetical protein F5Y19DRAFT_96051 [Xylariaceae sp. FL1651]